MLKAKREISIGGFCGTNFGKILNSYTTCKISRNKRSGNFCYKNGGEIEKCFARNISKLGDRPKFWYQNEGSVKYCFNDTDGASKVETNENESAKNCKFSEITMQDLKDNYNVSFNDFWKPSKDSDNLICLELKENSYDLEYEANLKGLEPIYIKTREELFSISEKIKMGDIKAASSYYVIESDMDLKGRNWSPIGSITNPFTGIFDGRGHKIYNFKAANKEEVFTGFFGVAENAVIANLQVDGIIKSGKCSGGFIGMNKNGKIFSCSAISQVADTACTGGFVGNNTGIIEGCYYNGKIKKPFPIMWLLAIVGIVMLLLVSLYIFNPLKNTSIFNNVPVDPYAVRTQKSNLYSGDGNKASFRFSDVIKFKGGEGDFDFGNPDTTNQSMTIKIQITDEELLNKIGKTGRTSEEQEVLKSSAKRFSPIMSDIFSYISLGNI